MLIHSSFSNAQAAESFLIKWPKVQRKIAHKRLAPLATGANEGNSVCPICWTGTLHPALLNATICCAQPICTECFLRVRPPPLPQASRSHSNGQRRPKRLPTRCPYCANAKGFRVLYSDNGQVRSSQAEQSFFALCFGHWASGKERVGVAVDSLRKARR